MAWVGIVDDDQWMADCYSQWLAAAGHKVWHTRDAQTALDELEKQLPDVLLLDLLLPHANAAQFLHTLKSYADWGSIPVILCSSSLPQNLPALDAYGVRKVAEKSSLTPKKLNHWIAEVLHETV